MSKQNSTCDRGGQEANIPGHKQKFLLAGLVFFVCITVQAAHHFLSPDKCTFLYDGAHYLETSVFISKILNATFSGDWSGASAIVGDRNFQEHILFDGPVVPLIPALLFSLFHRVPEPMDWETIVFLNAFCQSLSAVLLLFLASEVTESLLLGGAVALLFALQPAVIVNSGRFLTEPWVVLFSLAFVFLITRTSSSARFCAGLFAGLVTMTKAALFPAVAVVILVAGFGRKQIAKYALAVCAGVVVAIAPWFLFTSLVLKQPTIFTLRQPAYNAAVGVDLDTDGWCALPESSFVTQAKNTIDPLTIQMKAVTKNGGELAALSVRKLGRLFAHPWNDLRQTVFGVVTPFAQEFVHKLLLCVSFFGIGMWLVQRRVVSNATAGTLVLSCSLILVAGHLVYVFFQAMGRYLYTALPFLLLFTGFGIKTILDSASKWKPLVITISVVLVMLLAYCEQFQLPYGGFTKNATIMPGRSLDTEFNKPKQNASAAVLLVDGDERIEDVRVAINGERLDERLRPAGQFHATWYYVSSILRDHACFLGKPQSSFRQWRGIVIPLDLLKSEASNTVSLINDTKQPMTIYGDCVEDAYLPSPAFVSSDKMLVSMTNDDLRIPQRIREERVLRSGGKPCIAFVFASDKPASSKTSDGVAYAKEFSETVASSSFPQEAVENGVVKLNLQTVSKTGTLISWVHVPQLHSGSQLVVTLKGKARVLAGDGRVGVRLLLVKRDDLPLVPYLLPDFVKLDREWTEFTLTDAIPQGALGGPIKAVGIELFPGPVSQRLYGYGANSADAEFNDLRLHLTTKDSVDLTESILRFY